MAQVAAAKAERQKAIDKAVATGEVSVGILPPQNKQALIFAFFEGCKQGPALPCAREARWGEVRPVAAVAEQHTLGASERRRGKIVAGGLHFQAA